MKPDIDIGINADGEATLALSSLHGAAVRSAPFAHVVLDQFLSAPAYQRLQGTFAALRARGLSEQFVTDRLARFPGYDAYCWVIGRQAPPALALFLDPRLRDHCQRLFDLPLGDEMVAEFHHHLPGSRSDAWHDDYNLAYFSSPPGVGAGMRPWHFECNYMDGGMAGGAATVQRCRAVTLIYYFGAEGWQDGMGGETELGWEAQGQVSTVERIAPLANRLLAFACSPSSYHRFMSNHGFERNSLILWYHGQPQDAARRHGHGPRGWSGGDIAGGARDADGLPVDHFVQPGTLAEGWP